MTLTSRLFVAGLIAFVSCQSAIASGPRSFYIDPYNGNDNNSGVSPASPFRSFFPVMWGSAQPQPGDKILLSAGTIIEGPLFLIDRTQVTVDRYGAGPNPIITRNTWGPNNWNDGIEIRGGGRHVIQNIKFDGIGGAAIQIGVSGKPSDSNVVRGVEIMRSAVGVGILCGNNNVVCGSYIHDLFLTVSTPCTSSSTCSDDTGAIGVEIGAPTDGTIIALNHFERCKASSSEFGWDGGAVSFYAYGGASITNTTIALNYITDCVGVSEFGGDYYPKRGSISNVYFIGNLAINNFGVHTYFHSASGQFGVDVANVYSVNETFIDDAWYPNVTKSQVFGVAQGTPTNKPILAVINGIFVFNGFHRFTNGTPLNVAHDYNLFYWEGSTPTLTFNTHEVFGDPMFMDRPRLDFRTKSYGPGINRGLPLSSAIPFFPPLDIYGGIRLRGASMDFGAAESY